MILNSLEYYTDDLVFRLSSRNVYAATPRPEIVERHVWDEVQQAYEKRVGPRNLLSLACMDCHKILRM